MFWEVNRGGALILPGAQGLVFMARRSRRCGAANQILASSSMLNPSRRGRSGTLRVQSAHRERFSAPGLMLLFVWHRLSFWEWLLFLWNPSSMGTNIAVRFSRSVPAMSSLWASPPSLFAG